MWCKVWCVSIDRGHIFVHFSELIFLDQRMWLIAWNGEGHCSIMVCIKQSIKGHFMRKAIGFKGWFIWHLGHT